MKRFLIYCIVLVVMLFLGFTTYYFVANKENIVLAFDETYTIKLNVGETFELDKILTRTDPHPSTTITVENTNSTVLAYDESTQIFTALTAGNTTITITPSNLRFGPFVFNVNVGNGLTQENPYYISNDLELRNIGTGDWTLSKCYELISDIYLTTYDWTPIAQNLEFTGIFNGSNFTIYNLTLTASNTATNAGLFDTIGSIGAVKNVKFADANILGAFANVGVVAGVNKGTISLCEVTGSTITNTKTSECFTGGIVGSNEFVIISSTNNKIARIGMCGVENLRLTSEYNVGGISGRNYASLIENCYAVLDSFNGTSAKFGGIVGKNIAYNGTFYKNSIISFCHSVCYSLTNSGLNGGIAGEDVDFANTKLNVYSKLYYSMDLTTAVGSANYTNTASTFTKKTETEMQAQATYSGWDFTNVWEMATLYAKVNFEKVYTSSVQDSIINENTGTDETPDVDVTSDEIYDMICEMKTNPTVDKGYVVNSSYVIDLSEAKWSGIFPIGTKQSPFTGRFYTTNNAILTFKNLTVTNSTYSGFFGVIGSGAIIKGINFYNVTLTNTSIGYMGAICGYADSNSNIYNCNVSGINISGIGNIGGAVGCNYGIVYDVQVDESINSTFTDKISASGTSSVGGVVGLNSGLVQNSNATDFNIETLSNSSIIGGGIVGYNNSQILNCGASNLSIMSSNAVFAKVGGISGVNEKEISSSFANHVNVTLSTSNSNSTCGGITSINATNGTISNSMWLGGTLTSYYVGGICSSNYGTITACSVGNEDYGIGQIKGNYIGGLACINQQNGNINNCYVLSALEGLSNSGSVSGFANEIKGGSLIQYCFGSSTITGKGDMYADTSTMYKNFWAGFGNMVVNVQVGNIVNSLIVNVSGRVFQGYGFLIDLVTNPFLTKYEIICDASQAKGSDNYTCFTDKGFSESIWNFDYASNHYPTLKNAVAIS